MSGDQISYYVAGRGLKVKVSAAARLAAEYDPAHPDENVEYYQAKLAELYAKFKPYAERRGLFSPDEVEDPADAPEQQSMFERRHGGASRASNPRSVALAMKQNIVGFHQDEHADWVAELQCGHTQHVRHRPPWQQRPWVTTAEGRQSRLGIELECKKCDECR